METLRSLVALALLAAWLLGPASALDQTLDQALSQVPAKDEADPPSYKNYALLSVEVDTPQHAAALHQLTKEYSALDVLGRQADGRAVVMVPPHIKEKVYKVLELVEVPHTEIHADVQQLLESQARFEVPTFAEGEVSFSRFMRYAEIQGYLRRLAAEKPDLVTLEEMGQSWEGRNLTVARLSLSGGKAKHAILVDGGFHAREWISPAMVLYLLQQLTEGDHNKYLLEDLDWYLVPLINPDGYEYSHTNNRFWRKNRSKMNDPYCKGVDLNRNFGFHWRENGASAAPCDITFAGPTAFSEPETQHFRDYVLNKNKEKTFKMYLTLHSFGWFILHPWGFTAEPAEDAAQLTAIGEEANSAMVKAGSQHYRVGSSTTILYPAAGGSDDWCKGEAGIQKSYTVELPGGGSNGFDIEASKIQTTVTQVFEGIKVFAKHAKAL